MADRLDWIEQLRTSTTRFTDSFRGLDAGPLHFHPAPGRWSIAEIAEHVIWAETGSARLIQGHLIKEPAPPEVLAATIGGEAKIDQRLQPRGKAFEAPDVALPKGRWKTAEEMITVFEDSRRSTIGFLSTTDLDLDRFAFPHPIFGPLTGWQWVRFMVKHCIRHIDQIEDNKKAPGYPG